jgi:molybdopterin-synthase adenylyltransferase
MQDRFRRQKAFVEVGERGQELLSSARVAICGMGALGAMVAERLCRSGIGYMRLIDRDWVELDNLPRQTLYTTRDAIEVRPKSIAAREHLLAIDPDIVLDAIVEDVTYLNATDRLSDVDCIIDGTDNFETRYLINDVSVRFGVPWVHAGIVGASGQSMAFAPGKTACFRCLLPEPPPAEQMQTCDSAGVLGAAVGVIASWQAMEAIKILLRKEIAGDGFLRVFDLWSGDVRNIQVPRNLAVGPLDGQLLDGQLGCRTCVQNEFDFLNGAAGTHARVLCGRGAVQIQGSGNGHIDLAVLSNRLRREGQVTETPFLVRFSHPPYLVSVFSDGRAIVQGTENPDEARKIYARWIGG